MEGPTHYAVIVADTAFRDPEGVGARPAVYYISMAVLFAGQSASLLQRPEDLGYLTMECVTLGLFGLLIVAAIVRWLELRQAMILMIYSSVANIILSVHMFDYGGTGSSETLLLFSMIMLSYTTLSGLVMGRYNTIVLALVTIANAVAAVLLEGAVFARDNFPVFVTLIVGNAAVVVVFSRSQESLMTSLRHANQALSRQTRELERVRKLAEVKRTQTEARYQAIVQDQTDLICRFFLDGRISFANDAFCRYFDCGDAVNQDFFAIVTGSPDLGPPLRAQLLALPPGQSVSVAEQSVEHLASGRHWLRWINRPINDDAGRLVEYQVVGSDITDMRLAYEQLAEEKDTIENARGSRRIGLGITGLAELLSVSDADTSAEYVAQIRQSAKTLTELISEILDVSRIEAGRTTLRYRVTRLEELIETTASLYRPEARQRGLQLNVSPLPDLPPLLIDPLRVRQTLYNLIGNALKYTPSGSISLEVSARPVADSEDQYDVDIHVHDTGVGIPERDQSRLFETFTRGTDSRHYDTPGVGLGLAITRRLVELMGGTVSFSSREGVGSTFSVHLQCRVADAADAAGGEPQSVDAEHSLSPEGNSPRRVVVGEDNEVNRKIISRRLELAGHTVTAVEHGGLVIEALEKSGADVIVIDVRMPVVDGVETTRRIRAREDALAHVPIVAVTGFASTDEETELLNSGITRVVSKPIDYDELFRVIEIVTARPQGS